MKKDVFCKILNNLKEESDRILKLYDLGVDLINYDDKIEESFWLLMKEFFKPNDIDLIEWWLYEDVDKKLYSTEDGKELADLNACEDLYAYIFENDDK